MRAIILAAGQGMRLRPYTDDRPKCMVELGGKPLIQHQLDVLTQCGVEDISIASGYRADQLERFGRPCFHNPHYDVTNMVESLMCARELLDGRDDVLILYADIAYEARVLEALMACDAPFSTAINLDWYELWRLRMDDPLSDAETLILDDDDHIVELGKKPKSLEEVQGQYMGLIQVKKELCPTLLATYDGLDRDATFDGKDLPNMYMTSFLQILIDAGHPLKAVPVHGGWIEVDTTEDLEEYRRMLEEGLLRKHWNPGS